DRRADLGSVRIAARLLRWEGLRPAAVEGPRARNRNRVRRHRIDRAHSLDSQAASYRVGVSGIPVTGVNELVVEVLDLDPAERVHAGVLGLPVVERGPEREAIWVMAGDRTRIGLWRPQVGIAGGRGGVHVHYAMHIPADEYDGAVSRLREHGYEPHEVTFDGYGGSRAAHAGHPAGNGGWRCAWGVASHLPSSIRARPSTTSPTITAPPKPRKT